MTQRQCDVSQDTLMDLCVKRETHFSNDEPDLVHSEHEPPDTDESEGRNRGASGGFQITLQAS